ncbi:class F sortase [Nonomuraea endophytica]|uniref:Class F sortase n=1 Tax=Nonomuraea endophytica TaxID=714136 RepID=A0A7W8EJ15_9ACTN|nr:class F sortase [Nonomuraea endophytica]MBB5081144.1 hypothetical protein [Nonomuraea endophytica]
MRAGAIGVVLVGAVLVVVGKPGLEKVLEGLTDLVPSAAVAPMSRSEPVRLEIPGLKLKAGITPRGLNKDGTARVPSASQAHLVSWYKHGPAPGEPGAAALFGHVDSTTGPAVFHSVATLRPDALIKVVRADASTAMFRVRSVEAFPKRDFPSERVYSDTDRPELRLITCGGTFDPVKREYADNVVVFAGLAGRTGK